MAHMNSIKIRTVVTIIALIVFVSSSIGQTTIELRNLMISEIMQGDCNLELQKKMKELCLAFDSTKNYYSDVKNIKINAIIGYWNSDQFDNVVESNNHNILIKNKNVDCYDNKKNWHCLLSPISFNSDSTVALIQYHKFLHTTNQNETGTLLFKIRGDKWTTHFVIDSYSIKSTITRQ